MDPVIPKPEPIPEGSISSSVSTPEAEVEALTQDVTQTQKRKGGRKPVRKILFVFYLVLIIDCNCQILLQIRGPALHRWCFFFFHYAHFTYEHLLSLFPTSFPFVFFSPFFNILYRSMPLRKNVSNAIGRLRLLFGSVAPNTSVSWSPPSSAMKTVCKLCSRITVLRLMSV